MSGLPVAPFDSSRYIGTVCHVRASTVDINLPRAALGFGRHYAGYVIQGGQVGEFVVIEGDEHAVLGRIIEVRLPERERLSIEPTSEGRGEAHPVGTVQILTSVDLSSGRSLNGVPMYPRIAQHVYSAHPLLVKRAIEADSVAEEKKVLLAVFPHAQNTSVAIKPGSIFGRHCAVLGATGGGKSWTVAKLVEEIVKLKGKAILFDATGEFHTQAGPVTHVHLGGQKRSPEDARTFVSFPYQYLTETDLFVLFKPSGGTQAPKLREALRSLKVAAADPAIAVDGLVKKANRPRGDFEAAMLANEAVIQSLAADFDISKLTQQIGEECVFPTGSGTQAATHWGGVANNDLAYCTSLISRIEAEISSDAMTCLFKPAGLDSLPRVINNFLKDAEKNVLRVSLEELPFEHNTRELVTNAIGRFLLRRARNGAFREAPLVVILDEAHQFLNKSVGDELSKTTLDAFGHIAKEGRKYGLTCVLATQRPRDIPEDVLSQMGMFVVHRLISERDRAVVEKACGNLDHSAASFLPTLGQGEAILVGVESPMPLPVRIIPPKHEPHSRGPDYVKHWSRSAEVGYTSAAIAENFKGVEIDLPVASGLLGLRPAESY